MKNTLLLIAAVSTLSLSACGSTATTDTTTGSGAAADAWSSTFGIESCDKYVKLMDCVISKIPADQQAATKQQYTDAMAAWKKLPADQLKQVCDTTVAQLDSMKDTYKSMGCDL